MFELELQTEICRVFSGPMGLSEDDITVGHPFCICFYSVVGGLEDLRLPFILSSFEWNGHQVRLFVKSWLYLHLAGKDLPALQVKLQ